MALLRRFGEFLQVLDLRATGKWFILSAMIGVVAGLGAIVFQFLTQAVLRYVLTQFSGFHPGEAAGDYSHFAAAADAVRAAPVNPWMIVVVMTLGGLATGVLVYTFAPEAEGHGTDAAIDAFHNKRGQIRGRTPLIKTLASAITLGTGGSAGREGPIAQIGAGFGSVLATRLGLSTRDRRVLLAAGMGAGVGSIFRAPLAGALFAGEILYKDAELESDVIVPGAIASIIGYSVFRLSLPPEVRFLPLFGGGLEHLVQSPLELVPFALMSVVLVAASILYIKVFYGAEAIFRRLPIVPHVRPAIGAGLAGILALGIYFALARDPGSLAVLSTGYGALQAAFGNTDTMSITLLLVIALGKIFTTALTIGSGGSGGVFGPSVVIGGCLGGAMGQYFHLLWPELVTQPQAYAIVGMAGFFAGCAHAPFSTIIMVSEITGDYSLLLPTMWTSTLCFLLCRRWTIYKQQVPTRMESPAHRGDFIVDVLEGIKVGDVYRRDRKIVFIPESMSLDDIVHKLAETAQHYFPVVDRDGRMVGIFSADDVRAYLYDETIWQLAVARDIMAGKVVSVAPADDLNTALKRFTALNLDELPVVDPEDPGKLLGLLRHREAIAAYNRALSQHKQQMQEVD
jgi:CIC family chloride channel protein